MNFHDGKMNCFGDDLGIIVIFEQKKGKRKIKPFVFQIAIGCKKNRY